MFQLELAGKSVIKWLVIMVMETPHISCAGHSCAFLSWPLFNPQPCPDAPPWEGGSQARRGLHPAPPVPLLTPAPRNGRHPQEVTRAVTLIKLPPFKSQVTSSGHQKQRPWSKPVPTTHHHPPPHPQHLSFCSQMHVLASEDPFCRGLGLSQGPTDTEGSEECQTTLRLEGRAARL